MKPVIKRLIIKRFRSFASDTVEFDNPVFLVGKNGAGKTNFADIFSFVSEAMSSPLQAVFDRRGGIAAVRNRSGSRSYPPNLGLSITTGPINATVAGARFAFEVRALPNYGFEIVREQCEVKQCDGSAYYYDRAKTFHTNAAGLKPSVESSALMLPVIGGDERFALLFKVLSGMRAYSIEPAKLRNMQEPDSGVMLKSDGSNAASVLQEILRGNSGNREKLALLLEAIVPFTKSVKPKRQGNKLTLEFVQEWASGKRLLFQAFNMSDGTLRALGLIMAVFQTPAPSALIIEEPEATIHPGALGAVLDLIRRACKNMQVIITTNSPELLDASWIEDKHLRIITWDKGASHVLSPDDASREAMKKHLMGAGELLRSNALNAAPLFKDKNDLANPGLFEDFE